MSNTSESTTPETTKSALDAIKEQREALKNFYKLQQQKRDDDEIPQVQQNSSSFTLNDIDPPDIEDIDEFIAREPYLNILKVENKVLDRLNSSKSEIQSIIYNNYYELIKINNVLEDLTKPIDGKVYLESINDNLDTIRSNLAKIKSADIDIFDDINKSKE